MIIFIYFQIKYNYYNIYLLINYLNVYYLKKKKVLHIKNS